MAPCPVEGGRTTPVTWRERCPLLVPLLTPGSEMQEGWLNRARRQEVPARPPARLAQEDHSSTPLCRAGADRWPAQQQPCPTPAPSVQLSSRCALPGPCGWLGRGASSPEGCTAPDHRPMGEEVVFHPRRMEASPCQMQSCLPARSQNVRCLHL